MNFCNEKNMVFLAPMAGVSDRAFREICKSYGASYTVTEMVSSKGLTMQDKKSKELLFISDIEHPAGAQIFGDSPETMALAAKKALEFNPDFIDINMGCPAPKIAGNCVLALICDSQNVLHVFRRQSDPIAKNAIPLLRMEFFLR